MPDPSLEQLSDSSASDPLLVQHRNNADTDSEEETETEAERTQQQTNKFVNNAVAIPALVRKRNLLISFLQWYSRFSGSTAHQDKLLKLIQWTLSLLSSTPWPKRVALEISFARYVTRLLELPLALDAVAHDSWVARSSRPSTQVWYRWMGRVLAGSMLLYYPAEHMAYVLWMKPKSERAEQCTAWSWVPDWKAEKWSYWSCRCWCVYIVAEMVQNLLQLRELAVEDDEDGEKNKSSRVVDTQLQLARNSLFLLPAIHWSLPSWDTAPWLRDNTVTWLMWAEAVLSFYQAYRKSV